MLCTDTDIILNDTDIKHLLETTVYRISERTVIRTLPQLKCYAFNFWMSSVFAYLNPGLVQFSLAGQLFSAVDVGVVTFTEGCL